jgi:hypothetical protein
MMRITLTKREAGRLGDGPKFVGNEQIPGTGVVYRYKVEPMQAGEDVDIANFGAPSGNDWRIYLVKHRIWAGNFESADQALAEVQRNYCSH